MRLLVPAIAVLVAQAAEPPKVGTYDLELTTDEGTLVGELAVARAADTLAVRATVRGHSPATRSFVREAAGYVFTVAMGETTVRYRLAFAGDSLRGSFRMSTGGSGTVAGKLRQ